MNSQTLRAESYRQLRTNLQFVDVDDPVKAIIVTSPVAGEGKSTSAVNLAISFAETNRSVILIDADLRRPKLADYLGLEGAVGLTNVLAHQVDVQSVIQPWGKSTLDVLLSGSIPPNPSELLGSNQMLELIDELRATYDMIIIDTPPVLPVTDAAVVAAHVDGAVVVVRYGRTKQNLVELAVESLRAVDARILGAVLNFAPTRGAYAERAYGSYGGYSSIPVKPARRLGRSRTKSPIQSDIGADVADQDPISRVLPTDSDLSPGSAKKSANITAEQVSGELQGLGGVEDPGPGSSDVAPAGTDQSTATLSGAPQTDAEILASSPPAHRSRLGHRHTDES